MTSRPLDLEKMKRTKPFRWMIGAATATVAATVLTMSSGSIIAAFDVLQAGRDGFAGAGQAFPETGEDPGIRVESSEVEAGESVTIRVVLNVAPSGLSGYQIEVSLDDPSVALISGIQAPDLGLSSSSVQSRSSVRIAAVDLKRLVEPGGKDVTIAFVEVQGLSRGTAGVNVAVLKMDDDFGQALDIRAASGSISVK